MNSRQEAKRIWQADREHRYTIRSLATLCASEFLEQQREANLDRIIDKIRSATGHTVRRVYAAKIYDIVARELKTKTHNIDQLLSQQEGTHDAQMLPEEGAGGDTPSSL